MHPTHPHEVFPVMWEHSKPHAPQCIARADATEPLGSSALGTRTLQGEAWERSHPPGHPHPDLGMAA